MNTKHTQGQWQVNDHNTNVFSEHGQICMVYISSHINETEKEKEQREANLKLIASAPEMLLLLKELTTAVELLDKYKYEFHVKDELVTKCKNIIKQATE